MESLQFSTKYLLKPEAEALLMKQITQLHNIIDLQKENNQLIFKEGEKKGIQVGQQKEKLEIAKAMLLKDYPVDDIVALTGLSIDQVEQLKQVD